MNSELKSTKSHPLTIQFLGGVGTVTGSKFKAPPKNTFLVHGEPQASDALRVRITDALHWKCQIPKPLEAIPLE